MRWNKLPALAAVLCVLITRNTFAAGSLPGDVSATFTATVTDVTCQMTIADTSGNSSATSLTIPIGAGGQVLADQIPAGGAAVSSAFKLLAKNCSLSLQNITTTITATAVSGSDVMIDNTATETPAKGVALSLTTSANQTTKLKLNSALNTGALGWTISNDGASASAESDLIATLVQNQSESLSAGKFQALATFSFVYE